MLKNARKIEKENLGDTYVYVIKCDRDFSRPDNNGLYRGPKMYDTGNINDVRDNLKKDLFEMVVENELNISESEYEKTNNNCFEFKEIINNQTLPVILEEYPVHGIIEWDNLYIPSWIVLSFFNRGGIFYVGESTDNLSERIRSHKNGRTTFFKLHTPVDLLEVWSIGYHTFMEKTSRRVGIFNSTERNSEIEEYVRSKLSKKLNSGRRKALVYSN